MSVKFSRVTGIFRGYTYEQIREAAIVLSEGRLVKNMEITLNTVGAFEIIKRIKSEFSDSLNVGAGTVLTFEELRRAYQAGATFVLSPDMMTGQMISFCRENGILSIPGAFTPSEIRELFRRGADVVKVFPANEISYEYAKKVCEPLGDLPLMAVGGVNAKNVQSVFSGGYQYVGSAGGIFRRDDLLSMNRESLMSSLTEFELQIPAA